MALTEADRARLLAIEARLAEHPFPPQLVVENTSHCNLKCVHCSHREMVRPRAHMARGMWDRIVEEVGREAPETELWPTFYGEALILADELWDRLDHAARAGCRNLVLNSNGTLLARKNGYERILASPLRRFILSLDGFTPETFEAIRMGARRDAVYEQVCRLLELKARSGRRYPAIICQFSLMPRNAHEVDDFRSFWTARGAEVKVRSMLEWTATGTVRAETIDHDSPFRIACPWANNTMAIHQNGDVVACAVDYEGRFSVGNVGSSSIRDLWARLGATLRSVHRARRWSELPEICRGCCDWQTAGAEYGPEQIEGTRPFWFASGL
jgi:radical SAM protein with 4Fe4S-binding SPASM domain